jgi:hypothetical protein
MANSGGMGGVLSLMAAFGAIVLAAPVALASPTPSPPLAGLLAAPPSSGYVSDSTVFPQVNGLFDAVDYLGVLDSRKPSQTLATLKADGFVQGYGTSWFDRTAGHVLLEFIVAFSGGEGANRWLPDAKTLSGDSTYLKGDISVPGIDAVYGQHFANPAGKLYADLIGFVKGNDYFVVQILSEKDDMGDTASKQARQEYDSAAANTIPPSRWPENASSSSTSSFSFGGALVPIAIGAGGVLVLALLVVVLVILLSGRRRGSKAVESSPQMSPDGRYWWDGQGWRDAEQSAPPNAMRSADGYYWWDGKSWRAAPSPAPPPTSIAS